MSARKSVALSRAQFIEGIMEPPRPSRAQQVVESGDLDLAMQIAEFVHALVDAAFGAMETEGKARQRHAALAELQTLRGSAFEAALEEVLRRLRAAGRI